MYRCTCTCTYMNMYTWIHYTHIYVHTHIKLSLHNSTIGPRPEALASQNILFKGINVTVQPGSWTPPGQRSSWGACTQLAFSFVYLCKCPRMRTHLPLATHRHSIFLTPPSMKLGPHTQGHGCGLHSFILNIWIFLNSCTVNTDITQVNLSEKYYHT